MARMRGPRVVMVGLLAGALPACAARVPVEELPTAGQTMAQVGARLSRSHAQGVGWIAEQGRRVLNALRPEERDALGRNLIRFRVDRTAILAVAVPADSAPFWLDEQGFARTLVTLVNDDGPFEVYQKCVPPGWVGLGVNGLDRSPRAHYAVFVLPGDDGPAPTITGLTPAHLRTVRAVDGVSPYMDAHTPFREMHPVLRGAALVQTSFAARGASVLR